MTIRKNLGRAVCRWGVCVAALVSAASGTAQQAPAKQGAPAPHATSSKPARPVQGSHEESPGERVFATNCARCHTPPDGFSQRISGTVVRHMRVRASLSAEDEKELLRFLNP